MGPCGESRGGEVLDHGCQAPRRLLPVPVQRDQVRRRLESVARRQRRCGERGRDRRSQEWAALRRLPLTVGPPRAKIYGQCRVRQALRTSGHGTCLALRRADRVLARRSGQRRPRLRFHDLHPHAAHLPAEHFNLRGRRPAPQRGHPLGGQRERRRERGKLERRGCLPDPALASRRSRHAAARRALVLASQLREPVEIGRQADGNLPPDGRPRARNSYSASRPTTAGCCPKWT